MVTVYDSRGNTSRANSKITDFEVEEERRVFYVAMTRAETCLLVTTREKNPSTFLWEAFVGSESEKLGRRSAESELHRRKAEFAEVNGKLASHSNEVKKLENRIIYANNGGLLNDLEKERDDIEGQLGELEFDIRKWRERAPDGLFKRLIKGGFSGREISQRIAALIQIKSENRERFEGLSENIRNGDSFIAAKIDEYQAEITHIDRLYDAGALDLEIQEDAVNDAANIYEMYRIFRAANS